MKDFYFEAQLLVGEWIFFYFENHMLFSSLMEKPPWFFKIKVLILTHDYTLKHILQQTHS